MANSCIDENSAWDPMTEEYNKNHRFSKQDTAISLYVTGIAASFDEESVRNLFAPFGKVLRCYLGSNKNFHTNFAFVNYRTLREAEKAIAGLNNKEFEGECLKVDVSISSKEKMEKLNFNNHLNAGNQANANKSFQKTDVSIKRVVKNERASKIENQETNISQPDQKSTLNFSNDTSTDLGLYLKHLIHGNQSKDFPEIKAKPMPCECCGNLAFFRCFQCKTTYYCCQECQFDNWSEHRINCLRMPIEDDIDVVTLTDVLYPQNISTCATSPQNLNRGVNSPQNLNAGANSPQNLNAGANSPQNLNAGAKSPQNLNAGAKSPKKPNSGANSPQNANMAHKNSLPNSNSSRKTSPNIPQSDKNARSMGSQESLNGINHRKTFYNHNAFQEPKSEPLRKPSSVPPEARQVVEIPKPKPKPLRTTLPKQPALQEGDSITTVLCNNPWDIYVQKFSNSDDLIKIATRLNNGVLSSNFQRFNVGSFCATKFTDGAWYRGKIEKIDGSKHFIHLIDFGEKNIVELSDVKLLPDELYDYPAMGFHLKLYKVKPTFSDELIKKCQDLLYNSKELIVKECEWRNEVFEVVLVDKDNKEITDFLVDHEEGNNPQLAKVEKDIPATATRNSIERNKSAKETPAFIWNSPPTILKVGHYKVGDEITIFVVWKPESKKNEICGLLYHEDSLRDMQAIEAKLNKPGDTECLKPSIGEMFGAQAKDGVFYRAVAKEVSESKLNVIFVDYGNDEDVKITKKLSVTDQSVPSCLLIVCDEENGKFVSKQEVNSNITGKIVALTDNDMLLECNVEGCVKRLRCYPWFRNLLKTPSPLPKTQSVAIETPSPKQAEVRPIMSQPSPPKSASNSVNPKFDESLKLPSNALNVSDNNRVAVVYVNFPDKVYVQKVSEQDLIESISESLAIYCDKKGKQPPNRIEVPKVGTYICAKNTDNIWYRGLVLSNRESIKVFSVDYGNEFDVTVENVAPLPREFFDQPPLAHRVTLDGVESIDRDSERSLLSKYFQLKIVSKKFVNGKCDLKARLFHGQVCFNDELKRKATEIQTENAPVEIVQPLTDKTNEIIMADEILKTSLDIGDKVTLKVTNIVSPNAFFCTNTVSSDLKEFEKLREEIHRYCEMAEFDKDFKPLKGQAVLAKYMADKSWRRATILVHHDDEKKSRVYFMDDGHFDKIPFGKMLPLPASFAFSPSRAVLASLYGVEERDEWEPKIKRKFKSILNIDDNVINCEVLGFDHENDIYHLKIPSLIDFLTSEELLKPEILE